MALYDEVLMNDTLLVIKLFCAGSKIHNLKINCILLGDMKNEFQDLVELELQKSVIKSFGIYVGYHKKECYNENEMRITMIFKIQ